MKNILVIVCTIFFMVSCLGNSGSGTVSDAEMFMASNDFVSAKKTCDNLISEENKDTLSAKDLCRLSIIYMKLSECINYDENIATAILCFRKANVIDADSVNDFLSQLPPDDARQYIPMLCSLVSPIRDISNDELIDTLDY